MSPRATTLTMPPLYEPSVCSDALALIGSGLAIEPTPPNVLISVMLRPVTDAPVPVTRSPTAVMLTSPKPVVVLPDDTRPRVAPEARFKYTPATPACAASVPGAESKLAMVALSAAPAEPIPPDAMKFALWVRIEPVDVCVMLPPVVTPNNCCCDDEFTASAPFGLTMLPEKITLPFDVMLTVPLALPPKLIPNRLSAFTDEVSVSVPLSTKS